MNVYQKLNEARERFHKLALKKSGHNKFAGYNYFELGDFLIPALAVFKDVGLCATISFGPEIAKMCVVNVDKPDEYIPFESPMGSAALKGCHEVQNVGAVETYQRRYLWVAALEIVEHDALDSLTGSKDGGPAEEMVTDKRYLGLTAQRAKVVRAVAAAAIQKFNEGDEWGAYGEVSGLQDNDEKLALWSVLKPHSDLRAAIKRLGAEERNREPATA